VRPARLAFVRFVVAAVVAGPLLGTVAAITLAAQRGLTTLEVGALVAAYVLTTFGVTIGFHRHFAHRTFRTSRTMQVLFVVLGSMALQGSLLYWVSTHRRHHQFSDTVEDPHSPHFDKGRPITGWRSLWRGHIGWMFARQMTNPVRFAPDLIRDSLIFRVQQRYTLWALLGLVLPPLVLAPFARDAWEVCGVFLWAGPVRVFAVHHASWAVGSISHMTGSRPFETSDRSANNWWVALFSFGEGLQNNHHAFPWAARHGFARWEPDLSGDVIDGMAACGLIWDVNRPSPAALAARKQSRIPK
jgi:stearoyl-CoA desaturase (Delta-9 desaturase)